MFAPICPTRQSYRSSTVRSWRPDRAASARTAKWAGIHRHRARRDAVMVHPDITRLPAPPRGVGRAPRTRAAPRRRRPPERARRKGANLWISEPIAGAYLGARSCLRDVGLVIIR